MSHIYYGPAKKAGNEEIFSVGWDTFGDLRNKKILLFFRTLRSDKPTSEELDKLIEMVRKEK